MPALADVLDAPALVRRLDGLLLTGSRSHVAAARYGADAGDEARLDEQRDLVALALAEHMIEAASPCSASAAGCRS